MGKTELLKSICGYEAVIIEHPNDIDKVGDKKLVIIDDFYVFFSLLDDETTRKFGEIVRDRDVVFCSTPYRFEWIMQNELTGGLEKCKVVFLISDEKHSLEIVTENYRGRYSDKELDNIIKKCKKHLDKTLVEFSLRGEKYRSYVPWLLIAWN